MHLHDRSELIEVAREVIRRFVLVLCVLSREKLTSTKMSRLLYWMEHICNKIQASDWYLRRSVSKVINHTRRSSLKISGGVPNLQGIIAKFPAYLN
jgi:hypothetical protein